MIVKELIAALLNEDMDNSVLVKTADNDVVEVDGILSTSAAPTHIATFLSLDCEVLRK